MFESVTNDDIEKMNALMKENEELIQEVTDLFYSVSEKEFANGYINWRTYKKVFEMLLVNIFIDKQEEVQ